MSVARRQRRPVRREQLLFVSPVMPRRSGGGRVMRAFHTLAHAATRYRVTLAAPDDGPLDPVVASSIDRYIALRSRPQDSVAHARWWALASLVVPAALDRIRRRHVAHLQVEPLTPDLAASTDHVHIFRLYTLPVAERLIGTIDPARTTIDLDDIDSLTHARIARVLLERGRFVAAMRAWIDARAFAREERLAGSRAKTLSVCSEADRQALMARLQLPTTQVAVVPNVYPLPTAEVIPPAPAVGTDTHRLLLVGTMAYAPNWDGALLFAEKVLPTLREDHGISVRFVIAGGGMPPDVARRLERRGDVEVAGFVPDLETLYAEATLVVCPLRAGGGTRIKILEAIRHGRAVVTTSLGVEGLDLEPGVHVAVADSPALFAATVARLLQHPDERLAMARAAFTQLRQRYAATPSEPGNGATQP